MPGVDFAAWQQQACKVVDDLAALPNDFENIAQLKRGTEGATGVWWCKLVVRYDVLSHGLGTWPDGGGCATKA